MQEEKKKRRHEAICAAAYGLLAEKGYDGASMLSIAKAAKASNETLYRWYGDKRGLFEAMVRDNAENIKSLLEQAIDDETDPSETLRRVSPLLLDMLLDDRAILLNRAAASDPTGELGAAISNGGRDTIQPLIATLLSAICRDGADDVSELADRFLGLLIGDLQIRRVIGVLPKPTKAEIEERTQKALGVFFSVLDITDPAAP